MTRSQWIGAKKCNAMFHILKQMCKLKLCSATPVSGVAKWLIIIIITIIDFNLLITVQYYCIAQSKIVSWNHVATLWLIIVPIFSESISQSVPEVQFTVQVWDWSNKIQQKHFHVCIWYSSGYLYTVTVYPETRSDWLQSHMHQCHVSVFKSVSSDHLWSDFSSPPHI